MIVIEFTGGTEEVFFGQAIYIEQRKEKISCLSHGVLACPCCTKQMCFTPTEDTLSQSWGPLLSMLQQTNVFSPPMAFKRMQWVETVEEMQQFLMLRWRESCTQGPLAWSNLKTEDMHVSTKGLEDCSAPWIFFNFGVCYIAPSFHSALFFSVANLCQWTHLD